MRAILFVSGTVLLVAIGALIFWRPTLAIALALLGGAISFWRMHRPHRVTANTSPTKPVKSAPDPVVEDAVSEPEIESEAQSAEPAHSELLDRVRGAGWAVDTAEAPWIVAVSAGVRVALRPTPLGPRPDGADVFDALAAKAREDAQYAAIVCEHRPAEAVAKLANDSRVHIVNLERLDAYLALASSFKPGHAQPAAQRRVNA